MLRYDTTLLTCFQRLNRLILLMPAVLLLAFGFSIAELSAQSSATPKNVYVPLTTDTYDLTVSTDSEGIAGSFSSINNLIDPDLNNTANGPAAALAGSSWITITDGSATGSEIHPAGSYIGFVVNEGLLGLGATYSISISDGTTTETISSSGLLSVGLGGGQAKIGFIAPIDFNEITFQVNVILGLGSIQLYYAEIMTPDDAEAPDLSQTCNLEVPWVQPDGTGEGFPVVINPANTGFSGITLGEVSGLDNIVDSDTDNFASITDIISVLGSTASISVRTLGEPLPGGTFAGFDVSTGGILSVGLLNQITISTYFEGNPVETVGGDALLVTAGLLSTSDRFTIGFQTTDEFDEIQINTGGGLLGLNLSFFRVHHAVVTNFCEGEALECRTDTAVSTPDYPVFINTERTGSSGVTEVCGLGECIQDADNLINGNPEEGAIITPLVSAVGSTDISVKFGAGSYGGDGSNPVFVGFDIENSSLLDVDVLSGIEITTYLDDTEVQTSGGSDGPPLVEVGADIFLGSGDSRRTVGFAATAEFDEVQLSITNVIGVNLSEIIVYQLVLRDLCPGGPFECGETAILESENLPVIINAERTGFDGLVCVDCNIENLNGVISADEEEYATIEATADLLSPASISVLNPTDTYPAGSTAGFIIDTNSNNLVELDLLEQLQINTYNNGVLQETSTGSDLLSLTVLFITIGSGDGVFQVGFETEEPYDEIQLEVGSLLDANILSETIDVYNAFVDFHTVDSDGNACPDITINLTGGSCFRTLSSPVAGLTYAEMLAPLWTQGIPGADYEGGDTNVWTWPLNVDGNSDSWVPLADMDAVIPAGSGFLMSVFDQDDFDDPSTDGWPKTITIPAGPQNASVLSGSMMNTNTGGWTLAGNPLQSNIDVTELTTTGLTGAYYVYDRNLSGETDGNPGGWRATADGYGDIIGDAIAVGQGFFVQNTNEPEERSIIFTNDARTSAGQFYGKEKEERKDFVRLQLTGENSASSAWVRFSDSGSYEQTYGDALKLQPMTSDYALLATQKTDEVMVDVGHYPMPVTDESIAIPLFVNATESGSYTLTATDFDLPSSMSLYLKDTETGTVTEIHDQFEYSFTISADVAKEVRPDLSLTCSNEPKKVSPVSQTRFLLVNEASVSENEIPVEISLEQNYPNPFNPTTVINYQLPSSMDVTLQVFDMTGRRVAVLQQGTMPAGAHTVNFDASNLSSGVYMYSLQAGQQVYTRKLTLIK